MMKLCTFNDTYDEHCHTRLNELLNSSQTKQYNTILASIQNNADNIKSLDERTSNKDYSSQTKQFETILASIQNNADNIKSLEERTSIKDTNTNAVCHTTETDTYIAKLKTMDQKLTEWRNTTLNEISTIKNIISVLDFKTNANISSLNSTLLSASVSMNNSVQNLQERLDLRLTTTQEHMQGLLDRQEAMNTLQEKQFEALSMKMNTTLKSLETLYMKLNLTQEEFNYKDTARQQRYMSTMDGNIFRDYH